MQWQCWKPEGEEDESKAWQDLTCDDVKFQEVKAALKFTAVGCVMQATISVWSPTPLEVKLHSVQSLLLVSTYNNQGHKKMVQAGDDKLTSITCNK